MFVAMFSVVVVYLKTSLVFCFEMDSNPQSSNFSLLAKNSLRRSELYEER